MGVLVSLVQDLSAHVIPVYAMGMGLAAQASVGFISDKGMAEYVCVFAAFEED